MFVVRASTLLDMTSSFSKRSSIDMLACVHYSIAKKKAKEDGKNRGLQSMESELMGGPNVIKISYLTTDYL